MRGSFRFSYGSQDRPFHESMISIKLKAMLVGIQHGGNDN